MNERIQRIRDLEKQLTDLRNELKSEASARVNNMPKRMRAFRKKKGLTQDQLAESLGISRGQVVNVELGNSSTSIPILLQICAALTITPNDLFGYTK